MDDNTIHDAAVAFLRALTPQDALEIKHAISEKKWKLFVALAEAAIDEADKRAGETG